MEEQLLLKTLIYSLTGYTGNPLRLSDAIKPVSTSGLLIDMLHTV